MKLAKRHKYVIAGLLIYWPLLFAATHLPIQDLGRRTGMSDKTMHWMAYLGLVFLIWLAVSPFQKVNWLKARVWIILTVIVWYGVIDEWLQGFVGRETSLDDFMADMRGTVGGLVLLSLLSFWPAALVVAAIFIFTISNRSYIELIWNQPYLNIAFHFAGYAVFTLVWIQYMGRLLGDKVSAVRWTVSAMLAPLLLLSVVKLTSPFFGKEIWPIDCVTALVAIVLTTAVSRFVCKSIWLEGD